MHETEAEVFVVDNASTDGSVEFLKREYPFVKFISNEKNEGFAKANNIALKECSGDYVLFLNPDTIIPENILKHCVDFFDIHPEAGSIGVRMIDGSGNFLPESKRAFPTARVSFLKLSGLSSLFPQSKFFNKYSLVFLSENEIHEADVLCGAFMMVRKKLLRDIGGFDESFFMYGEDIDLCYRVNQSGYKNFYLGTEVIIHFKGESSWQDSLNRTKIFYDAMHVFVSKHYKRKWLMNGLLRCGIFTRKLLSLFTSAHEKQKRILNNSEPKVFLLAGDPISASEAEHVVKLYFNNAEIKKLQSIHSFDQHNTSYHKIVFCTGNFSCTGGIEFMISAKNKFEYYWHGYHTKSIVGSSDKNSTGKMLCNPKNENSENRLS
jgi:N-acetylglucosaminyl-diphospho-decaprenol L-rhamnosyltransferase